MKQDDIEKILQQYGTDRRQQQQVSDNLHGMARQQKRRVLWACTVVLVAASVWTLHHLAPHQQAEETIVAQQDIHTQTESHTQTPMQQNTFAFSPNNTQRPTIPSTPPLFLVSSQQESNASSEITAPEPSVTETEKPSENTEMPKTDVSTPKDSTLPILNQYERTTILLADNTVITPSEDESRHFRFMASVGASTFSRIGIGNADMSGLSNMQGITDGFTTNTPENGSPYTQVTPNATFAANIGVSYSISMGKKQEVALGVGLSGFSHQSEMTTYHTESNNAVNGTTTVILANDPATFYLFSLYANLPLTFNFKSADMNNIGWNLSITPSHSLVSSRPPGAFANGQQLLNPWRLTMGVGLTFPRWLFRRVSLTANLLSLYTSSSYHEIGIEIGF